MRDDESHLSDEESPRVPDEDLSGLRSWIEGRNAELGEGPVRARVAFWTEAARALQPEELGLLITFKEMNEERDSLTRILNRRGLERALADALEWEARTNQPVTVVFMDLDRFKALNDSYGHRVGDAVLYKWVRFLKENIRRADVLGRYGGEEIVAILRECTERQGYLMFDRIREDLSDALQSCLAGLGVTTPLTMSVGVAQRVRSESAVELLHRADTRMYEAKRAGRNLVIGGPPA